MKKVGRVAALIPIAILLFWGWYPIAANYDYSALAGTYVWHRGTASCLLVLRPDRTFHQELSVDGHRAAADGTWHRSGMSGADFSIQFLRVPGAKNFIEVYGPTGDESQAERQFYAHFAKTFGLFPVLHLEGDDAAPTFHRRFFR